MRVSSEDGCGFNGAAADQPRKWDRAGTVEFLPAWCFNGAAADQPRKVDASLAREHGPRRDASMGPRLISRGNVAVGRHDRRAADVRLQWGRG